MTNKPIEQIDVNKKDTLVSDFQMLILRAMDGSSFSWDNLPWNNQVGDNLQNLVTKKLIDNPILKGQVTYRLTQEGLDVVKQEIERLNNEK